MSESIHTKPVTDAECASAWDGRRTPRLEGRAVAKFKRLMGVCLHEGCTQIAGHEGLHNGDAQP
jgi:hypothetical protein